MPKKQKLTKTCPKHKSYQAKYAPRVLCYDCWDIFFEVNPSYRRLIEVWFHNG
jgi:hypothetical protein